MLDFSKARVCVIGDYIIDEYWHCTSSRISPEAPVAVCDLKEVDIRAGGAGNVIRGVIALGAEQRGIYVPSPEHRKIRVVVGRHQVSRVDILPNRVLYGAAWTHQAEAIEKHIDWSNIVVISDYGYLPESVILASIRYAETNDKYIIVDPKRPGRIYQGADLITPNEKEWGDLRHLTYGATALVTLGARGMRIIYPDDTKTLDIPSEAQEVFDVTGAGDTVVAVMAAAMGSGYTVERAAKLANRAAAIACRHFGTYAVTLEELSE